MTCSPISAAPSREKKFPKQPWAKFSLNTLNGLILEHMEFIPEAGTSLKISGYPIEIMQVKTNMVKTARISIPQDGEITSPQSELPLDG